MVNYESVMKEEGFFGSLVIRNLEEFKQAYYVLVTNRKDEVLADVAGKVYTRDLFGGD